MASGTPAELEGGGSAVATAPLVAEADTPRLREALQTLGAMREVRVDTEGDGLVRTTVTLDAGADARELIGRALFSHGIYLREIEVSRSSLESVFLELAGEDIGGAAYEEDAEDVEEVADDARDL